MNSMVIDAFYGLVLALAFSTFGYVLYVVILQRQKERLEYIMIICLSILLTMLICLAIVWAWNLFN